MKLAEPTKRRPAPAAATKPAKPTKRRPAPAVAPPASRRARPAGQALAEPTEPAFAEVVEMIQAARGRALAAVNTELVDLYWRVGEYISRKLETAAWGEGVVEELARYIQRRHPNLRGFTRRNLFRMRQFFETYKGDTKVSALLTLLPWTHHLSILGRCKRAEEREFYMRLAAQEKWSSRQLDRQLDGALFERAVLNPPKVSTALRQLHPGAEAAFRDAYLVEFLELPDVHEGPSIGVLLCASKNSEVVEYALSRTLSPALVAEYQTQLPDKKLLEAKLHEFYVLTAREAP